MITIDVTDELETKNEKNSTPRISLSDIIWWGIWKNGHGVTNPKSPESIFLGQITLQHEIDTGKWRV